MGNPIWLDVALSYHGLREYPGAKHNPQIIEWLKALGLPFRDDETPWCGTFIGGVLHEANMTDRIVKGPAGARNWLNCGVELDEPALGCIVVFWRGKPNGWSGHVGFVAGKDRQGNLMVLGGNQGNMVSIKPYLNHNVKGNRVLGYRWPGIKPLPSRYNLPIIASDGKFLTNEA